MELFPEFPETCNSLLKKHLTREIFDKLKNKKTVNNCTLRNIINSGIQNPDSSVGIYAGDESSYYDFKELFDPVIMEYHNLQGSLSHESDFNFSVNDFKQPDAKGDYIQSFRIRTGRNIKGFPLPSCMTKKDRYEVEKIVKNCLEELDGELSGKYLPLNEMSGDLKNKLINSHILFKEDDRFLNAAGITKHWPDNSGIFINRDNNFYVWVNEEDQLRIIAMDFSCDILKTCMRLQSAVKIIEKKIDFIFNNKLGYIASCPTNLGTSIRASVHIKLPELSLNQRLLFKEAANLNLQVRGQHGEHSKTRSQIFDISNKRRLGITEKDCISDITNGILKIIELEKSIKTSK